MYAIMEDYYEEFEFDVGAVQIDLCQHCLLVGEVTFSLCTLK